MTYDDRTGPGGSGERWNVNMPAVIGVVFVFLVGVIVWVVASSGGDDSPAAAPATTDAAPDTGPTDPSSTTPLTTTPSPMPDLTSTTAPATSAPASSAPETAPPTTPVTTAPGADPDAVPGDLAIPGRPMQQPPCDGSYITIIASAVGDQASASGIAAVLDTYPTSEYLRTDQTCSSLRPSVDGEPIYVVYFGPFTIPSDACIARADGTEGSYVKQLSDDIGPNQVVSCP